MRKLFLGIAVLVYGMQSNAQQLHFMSQFMQHNTMYNPAAAGMNVTNRVGVAHRSLWSAFPGNPKTTMVYGDFELKKYNSGVSSYLYRDETGPTSRTGIQLAYAYHINAANNRDRFGIGLELRGLQYAIDKVKLAESLGADPTVGGAANKFAMDAGFGVYYTNNKLTVGAAVSQLMQSKLQLADVPNIKQGGRLYRHYNITANYKIQTGDDIFIHPFFMARLIENAPSEFDLGAKVDYQDKLWWALNMRFNQFWSIQCGAKIMQRIRASYSYDYYTSPISIFMAGSGAHEIGLQFDLKK